MKLLFFSIFIVIMLQCLKQSECTFPVDIHGADFNIQVSVPYSFILPQFRRRRSVNNGLNENFESQEGLRFSRLQSMFKWLRMEEPACQKRLLCKATQNPNKYSPLSDLIIQHLDPRLGERKFVNNETISEHLLFNEYYEAGRIGFYPNTNCELETASCSSNPDDTIDWNLMKAFQLMKHFLNASLK